MQKTITDQPPLLSFEFASSSGQIQPLTFINPIKIIKAETVEKVLPCLTEVQAEIEKGYYAAGYLSYESAPAFQPEMTVKEGHTIPLLWFGIFLEPVQDTVHSDGPYAISDWKPTVNKMQYRSSIKSIKNAIEQGLTYQTNYTIRLEADFKGDELSFFQKIKNGQSSSYCAYLNIDNYRILSASPELFFHLKGNTLTTRPMKGTIKRGNTLEEDLQYINHLYHSEKNRAENVMIVDLLRNDLGMVAETGTVKVDKLFSIETFPTLHQMTSTVTATVAKNRTLLDIFKAIFPCGSITGAPKLTTMEMISKLEDLPREVYCGAIGYITPKQEAIFNVPIRTVLIDKKMGKATYGVGGGITWDSTVEDEYDEILTKARLLEEHPPEFQLLESLLLEDGSYFLLNEHLKRLKSSAHYFNFPYHKEELQNALLSLAKQNQHGRFKVRMILEKSGVITVEAQTIESITSPIKIMLADKPTSRNNRFLYHKTTNRDAYTPFQLAKPPYIFDVLLWNESEELTEYTNGNIVVEQDGKLWTPPVECGLLNGTYRQSLIQSGQVYEKVLTLEDLQNCQKVWFINSVRKWLEVEVVQ
ncbi:aminodeoxychorismate synthase component I [Bacillus marasmi]|uniref:aminodeoxychorismate synthase component I n=1 Tax=Bacillus marasmi TaxID=1926279 RepID=UPI0011CB1213|nr:aminodeoxychorismate synthase component I [Bacillus marasmi]